MSEAILKYPEVVSSEASSSLKTDFFKKGSGSFQFRDLIIEGKSSNNNASKQPNSDSKKTSFAKISDDNNIKSLNSEDYKESKKEKISDFDENNFSDKDIIKESELSRSAMNQVDSEHIGIEIEVDQSSELSDQDLESLNFAVTGDLDLSEKSKLLPNNEESEGSSIELADQNLEDNYASVELLSIELPVADSSRIDMSAENIENAEEIYIENVAAGLLSKLSSELKYRREEAEDFSLFQNKGTKNSQNILNADSLENLDNIPLNDEEKLAGFEFKNETSSGTAFNDNLVHQKIKFGQNLDLEKALIQSETRSSNVLISKQQFDLAPSMNLTLANMGSKTGVSNDSVKSLNIMEETTVSNMGMLDLDETGFDILSNDKTGMFNNGSKSDNVFEDFILPFEKMEDHEFMVSFSKDNLSLGGKNNLVKPNMQVSLAVNQFINSSEESGKKHLTINLHPHSLGAVKVEIISKVGSDGVNRIENIKIISEKASTHLILEEGRRELEKTLKEVTDSKEESSLQFEMGQDSSNQRKNAYSLTSDERDSWMNQFNGLFDQDNLSLSEENLVSDEYITRRIKSDKIMDLVT